MEAKEAQVKANKAQVEAKEAQVKAIKANYVEQGIEESSFGSSVTV